jgi:hypothetical protein
MKLVILAVLIFSVTSIYAGECKLVSDRPLSQFTFNFDNEQFERVTPVISIEDCKEMLEMNVSNNDQMYFSYRSYNVDSRYDSTVEMLRTKLDELDELIANLMDMMGAFEAPESTNKSNSNRPFDLKGLKMGFELRSQNYIISLKKQLEELLKSKDRVLQLLSKRT